MHVRDALANLLARKHIHSSHTLHRERAQGAMTAADLALSLDSNVTGLALSSGALIVVEEWAVKAQKHKALPVLITHIHARTRTHVHTAHMRALASTY